MRDIPEDSHEIKWVNNLAYRKSVFIIVAINIRCSENI